MGTVKYQYVLDRLGQDGYDCADIVDPRTKATLDTFGTEVDNDLENNRELLTEFFEHAGPGSYLVRLFKPHTISKKGVLPHADKRKEFTVSISNEGGSPSSSGGMLQLFMESQRQMMDLRLQMIEEQHAREIERLQGDDKGLQALQMLQQILKAANNQKTQAVAEPIQGIEDDQVSKAIAKLKATDPDTYSQYAKLLVEQYGEAGG